MKGRIKNILLYVADQWRGDTLGAMGHQSVQTPNIDAFAAEGVTFARHYCQALPLRPLTSQHVDRSLSRRPPRRQQWYTAAEQPPRT